MWRPDGFKGWKNPHPKTQKPPSMRPALHRAYEAGADAMYKALKEYQQEDCTEHCNTFPMKRMDCIYCQGELWNQGLT